MTEGQMLTPPGWIKDLPKAERQAETTKFWLRIAALYATPKGSLRQLSIKLGLHPMTIATYTSRGEPIPPETCIKIEKLLGVDLFPRDKLNPEHFVKGK